MVVKSLFYQAVKLTSKYVQMPETNFLSQIVKKVNSVLDRLSSSFLAWWNCTEKLKREASLIDFEIDKSDSLYLEKDIDQVNRILWKISGIVGTGQRCTVRCSLEQSKQIVRIILDPDHRTSYHIKNWKNN